MHRILRQIVEVDVHGGEGLGLEVQRRVSEICRHAAVSSLQAALAPFDDDGSITVIDRLEVDLGRVRLDGVETALTASLADRLATTLRERGVVPRGSGSAVPDAFRSLSADEALVAAVLHFVEHGRLPWWYAGPPRLDDALCALVEPWIGDPWTPGSAPLPSGSPAAALVQGLRRTLRLHPAGRERWTAQFSARSTLGLLKAVDAAQHVSLLRALDAVKGSTPGVFRRDLPAAAARDALDALVADAISAREPALARLTRAAAEPEPRPRDEGGATETVSAPQADDAAAAEGIHVDGAGIVLLHPFLPRFFEALGVARDDGTLARPDRAALLLRHLATGAVEAEEHELILEKALCGIPLEAPIAREAPVTDAERAEATALLEAAVSFWEALRGTSADGLRGNFLVRPGRLDLCEEEWVLRVERRSHDVLLDTIPWGVGHVKLPWMPRLMHVDWAA